MKQFYSKNWRRFLVFLGIFGPGLITAIADNDAGGVGTYSVAASLYGYGAMFLMIPQMVLLAVTQEIGARIAIVTKKGLGDLIREHFGIRWSIFIFLLLFLVNQGVVIQNVTGMAAAMSLFNLPVFPLLPFVLFFLFIILIKGNYRTIQRSFLLLTLFYLTYVFSAILAKPDWKLAFVNTIWPSGIKTDLGFIFARIAVLGTTITVWGQFFIHSYIIDKKIGIEHLKYERLEIYIGALLTTLFSFMMVVAVAATLYLHGIKIAGVKEAALAIKPFAGNFVYILFSGGLFVASILGVVIVPLATAYVFSELFGFEGSLDKSFSQSRNFYSFFLLQIIIALIVAFLPNISLFKLTLYVDNLNAILLPFIFYFLLQFSNNKDLMGRYVNNSFDNLVVKTSAVIIIFAFLTSIFGRLIF